VQAHGGRLSRCGKRSWMSSWMKRSSMKRSSMKRSWMKWNWTVRVNGSVARRQLFRRSYKCSPLSLTRASTNSITSIEGLQGADKLCGSVVRISCAGGIAGV
jgi:hypothetical protein